MKLQVFFCLFIVVLSTEQALGRLTCWTCENERSNAACLRNGMAKLCRVNQEACENEVRRDGTGMLLTKKCKQARACENNYIQNPRTAWFPTQCNTNAPSSVCRCCCGTDLCNRRQLACLSPTEEPEVATTTIQTTRRNPNLTIFRPLCDPPRTPNNGIVECSGIENNEYPIGTICKYKCHSGFTLIGIKMTECEIDVNGQTAFSSNLPLCQPPPPKCDSPPVPENGKTMCNVEADENGQYALGIVCNYECDNDYVLEGATSSTCTANARDSTASFIPRPPTCHFVPTCDPPEVPVNGRTECHSVSLPSGKYSVGTTCNYICNSGFSVEEENAVLETECTEYRTETITFAQFSPEAPTCVAVPPTCEVLDISMGTTTCSNENLVGSTCFFKCNSGYRLFPPTATLSTCQQDQMWNQRTPCCLRPCPPRAFMDLVIVLDSSSSIGNANWPIMLDFVVSFIGNFDIGEDAARIGLIRYNSVVDTESRILLNQFPESKADLEKEINNLPYNGEGTNTGNAIRYVRTQMFTPENGDRLAAPNVVLIITDGVAQDTSLLHEEANNLRKEGTTIFAVGIISQTAGLNVHELFTITGSLNKVIVLNQGFDGLDSKVARLLGSTICQARSCDA